MTWFTSQLNFSRADGRHEEAFPSSSLTQLHEVSESKRHTVPTSEGVLTVKQSTTTYSREGRRRIPTIWRSRKDIKTKRGPSKSLRSSHTLLFFCNAPLLFLLLVACWRHCDSTLDCKAFPELCHDAFTSMSSLTQTGSHCKQGERGLSLLCLLLAHKKQHALCFPHSFPSSALYRFILLM